MKYSYNWPDKPPETPTDMKEQFFAFVRKEWYHILRDRKTLFILIGMPIAQILIFGFALTNEIKNSRIAVIDMAKDGMSARYIAKIEASRYFDILHYENDPARLDDLFREGKIKAAVVIPSNFGSQLQHEHYAPVQVIADASDPNTGTAVTNYLRAITGDFTKSLEPLRKMPLQIVTETRMLYNPQLKGAYNFVPGVMAMVLMLVCTMMTSIAIVREKETGTMEVLLVSPLKPFMVIIAKSVPYLMLSAINIVSILLLSVFALGLPIAGNLLLLVSLSLLFTITCLSLGMLISSKTSSQQTAMLISLMGMFLPTLMLSGFMFPIENMPLPLKIISNAVPAKWFFMIVKDVMIKGVGVEMIWKETLILMAMTSFFLMMSIRNYDVRLTTR
ncbi:MAG: ABC transporter permease [Bacteroidota bacterium]|jgi:ABC-2 type transport system permease protein